MLALGPLKKSTKKTVQKTHSKKRSGWPGATFAPEGGGPLEQRKKGIKETKGDKDNAKGTPRRTRRGGGYIYIYIYIYVLLCVRLYFLISHLLKEGSKPESSKGMEN